MVEPDQHHAEPDVGRADTTTGVVIEALHEAMRRLRHASVRCLTPLGITPAQARALRTIARAGPGGLRMGELAELMGIVPRSATGLVDGLEAAGVVERRPDPDSRRSVVVLLTREGRDLQTRLAAARLEAAQELLAPLDDADRSALAALLGRLVGRPDRPGPNCPGPGLDSGRADRAAAVGDQEPVGDGPPLDLATLSFPGLTGPRDALLDDLVTLSADPASARPKLFAPRSRLAEVERNARIRTLPTLPAIERYTGVLYDALDVAGMTAVQRSRADARLIVTSAVFGMVGAGDRIPPYRCSNCARLPTVGTPERYWRAFLPRVVAPLLATAGIGEFVVDLRSSGYASFVPLPRALTAKVVSENAHGQRTVVSHFSKQHKGYLARALATSRAEIRDRAGVLRVARTAGLRIEPLGPRSVLIVT